MVSQIDFNSSNIRKILDKYSLNLVILFGSQATGHTHPKSDTDMAFLSDKLLGPSEIARMCFAFSNELRIRDLECTDLHSAPPLLLKQVALKGILLYEREPHTHARFKIYALKRSMEAEPLFRIREKSLVGFLEHV